MVIFILTQNVKLIISLGLNDSASRNDGSKANQWEFEALEFVNISDEDKPVRQDLGKLILILTFHTKMCLKLARAG